MPAVTSPCPIRRRSVWVIFNGEIYNFPELKRELDEFGHVFRTNSDTEVIVHGYRQWGDDVFNHLNGMFGLAIWDVRKERLILARDPFGIKLIYYKIDNGRLYFGSEIRAVLAAPNDKAEVDPNALNLFLRYRYTPSPHTMFKASESLRQERCWYAKSGVSACVSGTIIGRHHSRRPESDAEAREELARAL